MHTEAAINTVQMNYMNEDIGETLVIGAGLYSPFIKFKREQGLLLIKGRSMDRNAADFYAPIISMVNDHLVTGSKLTCYFYFKDMNMETSRSLFILFKVLGCYHGLGKQITVNWFADWHNNEMLQTGIDYAELYGLKVNILPI